MNVSLEEQIQNQMGVKTPLYDFRQNGNLHSYGLVGTSGELDTALVIFSDVMKKLVKLSELEKQVS